MSDVKVPRYSLLTTEGRYGRPVTGVEFRMPEAKHNGRGHNFTITLCHPDTNCCGARNRPGHVGRLSAQATVISLYKVGESVSVVPLSNGDVIEIDGTSYVVRDDVPLHDPYLYTL